ncbi:hypothetical protein PhCBS80983_g01636 [Powellomyces hirtus]|uniref:Uncharacterized protein n=1 Tax=Powellomyces hirtus TaxID=109895 RepID=A0A507E9D3_9FUNG|nr:hypothetical protein PhCBS80983_g01636 [Powellomyces hirtus]
MAATLGFSVPELLDDVFALYTAPNSATQKVVFKNRYQADAIFEDPLFRVHTAADREAQFASLPALFSRIEIERAQDAANATVQPVPPIAAAQDAIPQSMSNVPLVRIDVPNTQIYYLPKVMGYGPKIEVPGVTRLTVERDTGKVVKHQDVWNMTGEHLPGVLPLLGSVAAFIYAKVKGPLGKGVSLGLRGMNQVGLLK